MSASRVAWVCETCWRLYTAESTITRSDRRHGDNCAGKTTRQLNIDTDGWPLPGQLGPGEVVTVPCAPPRRPSAAIAGPAVSAPAAAAPAESAPEPYAVVVYYPVGYDFTYPPPPPFSPAPSPPRSPSPRVLVNYGGCMKPSNVLAWRRDQDKQGTKTPPPGRDKVMS